MGNGKMSVCIIGCGGFIGSHLVDRLLSRGTHTIDGIDVCSEKVEHCLDNDAFTFVEDYGGVTYGDVYHENEVQFSTYDFDEADPDVLFRHFDDHERSARGLLEKSLVLPAYDLTLKCSHTFNLLDARGVIGVNQRAAYINRVRALACACAEAWLERRRELGFPMLREGARPRAEKREEA